MKVKKLMLSLVFILGMIFVFSSNKVQASYQLSVFDHNVGWAFRYNNYFKRNYLHVTHFTMSNGATSIPVFCLQQQVLTSNGSIYNDPVIRAGSAVRNVNAMSEVSTNELPDISTLAHRPNPVDSYYDNELSETVRRSLNIAYVWYLYNQNDLAARSATQWFIWNQTTGYAHYYLDYIGDNPVASAEDLQLSASIPKVEDGYRYLAWSDLVEAEKVPHGPDANNKYYWETGLLSRVKARYDELCSYYTNFNANEAPVFNTTNVEVLPGQTISIADTAGVLSKNEYTVSVANKPAGVNIDKAGNAIQISVASDFNGEWEGEIVVKRFDIAGNDGTVKLFGNASGQQIVFAGGLQKPETKIYVRIHSGKITVVKEDALTGNVPQGDATLEGAQFTIYKDEDLTQVVDVIETKLDEEGRYSATSDWLPIGTYYVKETNPSEGYLINENDYEVVVSSNSVDEIFPSITIDEDVQRGRVIVRKYNADPDSTEESPAAGAILRLTLEKDEDVFYLATVDENGNAEFIDKKVQDFYGEGEPTIPFGKYILSEDETSSNDYIEIFDDKVDVKEHAVAYYKILADEPVPMYIKIQKRDADTGETVNIAGAKFKIWDCQNEEWISQMIYPSGEYIDEFVTNEEGYCITPAKLYPGRYVIYETDVPEGYYFEDGLRIPEDESHLGDPEYGGKEFVIDKYAMVGQGVYPYPGMQLDDLILEIDINDRPLVGQLEIHKTGEMLTGASTALETVKDGEKVVHSEEKATPIYTLQGLQGVKYEIYAAEDIKSPDGRVTYVTKGTLVATITTEEDGYATTDDLYLGEYEIKEIDAPKGYTVNDNIPNVTLTNDDPYNRVEVFKEEYTNDRQKLGLTFNKVFEDINYSDSEELNPKALFGIYAKDPIYNYKGNEIIKSNMLLDLVWADENGDVTSEVDLPEGTYVVRELYASSPYSVSTKETEFTLEYTNDPNQEFVVVEGEEYVNTPDFANLNLIKISTSQFGNITVVNGKIEGENIDEEQQAFLDTITAMTLDEVKQYLVEHDIKVISGAKYGIYLDEDCTEPLYIKNEETDKYEIAEVETDEYGIISLEKLPIGQYFVKELVAPVGYELSDEVVSVSLDISNKDATVYRLLKDDSVKHHITKTDFLTGEAIPNCLFEIRDENGELIVKSRTNEEGEGRFPIDLLENGKTYTYTEVEAPDIYNLNAEPHEFVASYEITDDDVIWTGEKLEVENTRKTREVIVRKVDAETGEPLQGCVFTIAMIDPETGEQKVNAKTGEPIYLVENAVTDENGEYVIPEAPMGTYKFTEIKAPEGYEMDEDLTGLVFTIDNNSPETIIFEVTNTGDIAVMMVSAIAVVSVCGIAFVMIRNKRKVNE